MEIGDYCSISARVQIYTHDTIHSASSGGVIQAERKSVRIGSRCYIGPNVIISKGITINDSCVIGENNFVKCDITDNHKASGKRVIIVKGVDSE